MLGSIIVDDSELYFGKNLLPPPSKYSQLPSGGNMPSNYRALAWRAARPPYTWINSFCWAWT